MGNYYSPPVLTKEVDDLRMAAGIEPEDSFESGSKWCVGDGELIALVAAAKAEERKACAAKCEAIALRHQQTEVTYAAGKKAGAFECAEALRADI